MMALVVPGRLAAGETDVVQAQPTSSPACRGCWQCGSGVVALPARALGRVGHMLRACECMPHQYASSSKAAPRVRSALGSGLLGCLQEVRRAFSRAVAVGIMRDEGDALEINPPEDAVLGEKDRVIGLAQSGGRCRAVYRHGL